MYRLRCALTPQKTLRITREIGIRCGKSTHQAKRFYNCSANASSAFLKSSASALSSNNLNSDNSRHYSFRPVGYSLSYGPNLVQEAMRRYSTHNSNSAINPNDKSYKCIEQTTLHKHEELDKLLVECLHSFCSETNTNYNNSTDVVNDNLHIVESGLHSFLPCQENLDCCNKFQKQEIKKEEEILTDMEIQTKKIVEEHTNNSNNKLSDRVFYFYPHKTSLLERHKQLYAQIISPFQSALCTSQRAIRVRDKDDKEQQEKEKKEELKEEKQEESEKTREEGKAEEDAKDENAKSKPTGKKGKNHKSFADNIRGLKEDYAKFPDIYNGANAILFIIFTVFCLCSTGTNTEEEWWLQHWGLDNLFRPYNWLLHSFLTNNFLSMTYAMMVLHAMCYQMLPTLGSYNLILYTCSTAVISGAVIWAFNRFRYGDGESSEKQFGPWDVVSAMFVMQYMYFGIGPIRTLNSFNSWLRYACWVGQFCIMYFDWQPTFVGALVGFALCKGVPRFQYKPIV